MICTITELALTLSWGSGGHVHGINILAGNTEAECTIPCPTGGTCSLQPHRLPQRHVPCPPALLPRQVSWSSPHA